MESNLILLWPFFGGIIWGVFIKPTTLLAAAFGLSVSCIAGLLFSSATNFTWVLGIIGMALPFYAAPAIVGSFISWGFRQIVLKMRGE